MTTIIFRIPDKESTIALKIAQERGWQVELPTSIKNSISSRKKANIEALASQNTLSKEWSSAEDNRWDSVL